MANIVFVVSDISTPGGLNKITIDIANQLVNNKHNVRIISQASRKENIYFKVDTKIDIKYLGFEEINMKKDFIKLAKYIKKNVYIEKNSYVVISEVGNVLSVYIALNKRRDLKLISWDHTSFYNGKKLGIAWWGRYISAKKLYKTVVITKEAQNCYYKFFNARNVIQIYNPVNISKNKKVYCDDSTKIISCGKLDNSVKGFDMLIEVASIVFKKYPEWSWDIYGEGKDRLNLQKKIEENGLENNVFLKGHSKNMEQIYREYSMFVLTSRHEGFGLVIVEAQQNKLPVISFNCSSGPSELIKDGINGYLIKCFETDYMAKKIVELIEDNNLRKMFSKKSSIYHEELDIKNIMSKWNSIFTD